MGPPAAAACPHDHLKGCWQCAILSNLAVFFIQYIIIKTKQKERKLFFYVYLL
jgi:hypothetical protein